jgi:hypothetical protein
MHPRSPPRTGLLGVAIALAACTGRIGDTPSDHATACATPQPGESPLRRLTRFEYNNTVRDLLGDNSAAADAFAPEEVALGFDNQAASLGVTALLAEQYQTAAEAIAARAVRDLPGLLGCDPAAAGEDTCAARFIRSFGKRAFRRPLDHGQVERLSSLYAWGRERYDFAASIELVVEAALQSPSFLYRVEFGMPEPSAPGVVALDPHETASRLSYLLWASMPDAELFAAADAGRLRTAREIEAQARRLLGDPRARAAVANFHRQWLGLDGLDGLAKDTDIYPAYHNTLRPLWKTETLRFLERVVFDEGGGLGAMFTAPYSMMNADLAAFYGVAGPTGDAFERVPLDPAQRGGFLTQAGVLARYAKSNQSSPVQRGKFVRTRLLCQPLPPPPNDMAIRPPVIDAHATTREKFREHSEDPGCAQCHELMDPIGFGFEHYDAIGAWRDLDHGLPVDASGLVRATQDADGPFDGAMELGARLAGSEGVRACVTTQWFRFAHGRGEGPEDACSLTELRAAFAAAGHDVRELLVALTQTDAFRYRRAVVPGK